MQSEMHRRVDVDSNRVHPSKSDAHPLKMDGHRFEKPRLLPGNAASQTNESRVLVGQDAIEVDSHVRKSLGTNAVIRKNIGAQLFVRRDCWNRIRNRVGK